jgi:hypothetical protein
MNEETNGRVTDREGLDERSVTEEMQIISIPERGFTVEKALAAVEKNVELFNKVKIIALKMTKASDWVDLGGNPYLMDRGTENVAIAFGVDVSEVRLTQEWNEDAKGRYYAYVASGKAYSKTLGRYVEDIGVCSQRDKFFGMVSGKLKEVADVDMANIRRKAVTNLYNRLIKRVIGLMGVTFADLEASGISLKAVQKVDYKSGGQKAEAAANLPDDAKKKRDAIWSMLMEIAVGDVDAAKGLLMAVSSFKDKDGKEHKLEDISRLTSEKWIASLYGKVKKEHEAVMAKREAGLGA